MRNDHHKELIFLIPSGVILDIFKNANLDNTVYIIDTLDRL